MSGAPTTAGDRTSVRRRRFVSLTAIVAVFGCAVGRPADAQSLAPSPAAEAVHVGASIADFIAEASQRSGIPQTWIAAVMRAESAFDPRATSPKGAMGLMQLMPDTWAALRLRLGLGTDPYDPRDNVVAGARYLRDLYDQFGAGGFLAAYNAGPGRYLDFLSRGRPLPLETRAYVAKIAASIDGRSVVAVNVRAPDVAPPPRPGIFVALADARNSVAEETARPSNDMPAAPFERASTAPDALFVGAWGDSGR